MTAEPPKISFPCQAYPIKVIGRAAPEFERLVRAALDQHVDAYDAAGIVLNPSRNGQFVSIRVNVDLASEAQLAGLFAELKRNPLVQMVL